MGRRLWATRRSCPSESIAIGDAPSSRRAYYLGLSYQNGQSVEKDDANAAGWYQKAVDRGDLSAANSLGILYTKSQGVLPDLVQA